MTPAASTGIFYRVTSDNGSVGALGKFSLLPSLEFCLRAISSKILITTFRTQCPEPNPTLHTSVAVQCLVSATGTQNFRIGS